MPQDKDTTMVFGEKNFLVSLQKAVSIILDNPSSLKFSDKHFGFPAAWDLRFGSRLKLTLLLFPFFQVSDPAAYPTSGIGKMLACGKDVFYRFLSDSRIDWWKFGYSLARKLIRLVVKRRVECHVLSMAKNGNAKYVFNQKEYTAKDLTRYVVKKSLITA